MKPNSPRLVTISLPGPIHARLGRVAAARGHTLKWLTATALTIGLDQIEAAPLRLVPESAKEVSS